MPLGCGNKITQSGNKSVISASIFPLDAPALSSGIPINIFNDPISNPRRGLNGTGMVMGQAGSALKEQGGYDALDPVPLDISKIETNNQTVWGNKNGTSTFFTQPFGIPARTQGVVDFYNIVRSYKHGITETYSANQHDTRIDFQRKRFVKGKRKQGGVQMGHQEQNNMFVLGNGLQISHRMTDQDHIVFCEHCSLIQNFSAYGNKMQRCTKCLQTEHLRLMPSSRNFLYTQNFTRTTGIELSINPSDNTKDFFDDDTDDSD